MNNQTTFLYGIGIGIIIGCIIATENFILSFITTYILAIWIARILLSCGVQSGSLLLSIIAPSPNDNKFIKETQLFDNSDIKINYNWYHNTIIIKKNLTAKIFLDGEKIENIIKDIFDNALIWDIFYQYKPLKIIYV